MALYILSSKRIVGVCHLILLSEENSSLQCAYTDPMDSRYPVESTTLIADMPFVLGNLTFSLVDTSLNETSLPEKSRSKCIHSYVLQVSMRLYMGRSVDYRSGWGGKWWEIIKTIYGYWKGNRKLLDRKSWYSYFIRNLKCSYQFFFDLIALKFSTQSAFPLTITVCLPQISQLSSRGGGRAF